ncbi:hypothetical protein EBU94_06240, partial [bacterium]|nr:hypothetical protein [bacterium]
MKQKIYRYSQYIRESDEVLQLTPQTYIETKLRDLEQRLRNMFEVTNVEEGGKIKRYGEIKGKEEGEVNFQDLGLELQSLELSKYSKVYDNVKLKFSDEEFLYDITFTINLKDAVPKDPKKDFSDKDIKECQVIFKKYDLDN